MYNVEFLHVHTALSLGDLEPLAKALINRQAANISQATWDTLASMILGSGETDYVIKIVESPDLAGRGANKTRAKQILSEKKTAYIAHLCIVEGIMDGGKKSSIFDDISAQDKSLGLSPSGVRNRWEIWTEYCDSKWKMMAWFRKCVRDNDAICVPPEDWLPDKELSRGTALMWAQAAQSQGFLQIGLGPI